MTTRERSLAMVAVITIFVVVGGLIAYQFFYTPLRQKDRQARDLQADIEDADLKLLKLEMDMPRLELMKKQSLPGKVEDAQFLYGQELNKMLREAEFPVGQTSVTPKPVDTRTSGPASKRLPYTRLLYEVTGNGDVANIVAFLDRFYRTPLLHKVSHFTIHRSPTTRKKELTMTAKIEALILEGVENRKTLLPEGVQVPPRLARSSAQYASIAGKDMFFGAPPRTRGGSDDPLPPPKEIDPEEFITLDTLQHTPDGTSFASLNDAYNNRRYEIRSKGSKGPIEVKSFTYNKDKKQSEKTGKDLEILYESGKSFAKYKVVRIDAMDIVIEGDDAYYSVHIGDTLGDARELSASAAKALGLPAKSVAKEEPKTADKKPPVKPGDVKKPTVPTTRKPTDDVDDDQ